MTRTTATLATLCLVFLAGTASASVFGTPDTSAWREFSVGYAVSNDLRGVSLGATILRSEAAEFGVKVTKLRSRVIRARSVSRAARTEATNAAAGRMAALPTAYPVKPDYSATTLLISAAYHPMSRLGNKPVDLALVVGAECSFYGDSDTRSEGLHAGVNLSRRLRFTERLRAAPRVGLEWNWASLWETPACVDGVWLLGRPATNWGGRTRYTLRVLEFGLETDYTLPWGQRLVVDNALRTWQRRYVYGGPSGRAYEYSVSLGVGLPTRW